MPPSSALEVLREPKSPSCRLDGSPGAASPVTAWRAFAFANAGALVKSVAIATSGARVVGAALFAFVATATEDTFAHQRSRLSCRTPGALFDLERDHLLRTIEDNTWRVGLVARMLRQVGADAAYPVRRRLDGVLRPLGDPSEL